LLIATLLCSVAPHATAKTGKAARDDLRDVRAAVEAATRKAADAYRRGDVDALIECTDPTAPLLRTSTGEIKTCAQVRTEVAARMGRVHEPRIRVHVDSVAVSGDTSRVLDTQHFSRKVQDSSHAWHVMTSSVRHRETWVRGPAGWRRQFIEELGPSMVLLDGKPYPSGPGGK
jgi:ketosteroid isomerase-like protein